MRYLKNQNGFGMYEIIGIAAVLIVAAFVVIPGFRELAANIMSRLESWLDGSIFDVLFPNS